MRFATGPTPSPRHSAALVDDLEAVRAPVRALIQEAMQVGGPPAAVERFWDYMARPGGWNRLSPELRGRLRASAVTLFEVELGTYELYMPDESSAVNSRSDRSKRTTETRSPRRQPLKRLRVLRASVVCVNTGTMRVWRIKRPSVRRLRPTGSSCSARRDRMPSGTRTAASDTPRIRRARC